MQEKNMQEKKIQTKMTLKEIRAQIAQPVIIPKLTLKEIRERALLNNK